MDKEEEDVSGGERFRRWRLAKGWTQARAAAELKGFSQADLSQFENRSSRHRIGEKRLRVLARETGIPLEDLKNPGRGQTPSWEADNGFAEALATYKNEKYEFQRRDRDATEHEKRIVDRVLAPGSKILDIGCGMGPFLEVAYPTHHYYGIDPIPEYIAKCHDRVNDLRGENPEAAMPKAVLINDYAPRAFAKLPETDGFHLIYARDSIHYLSKSKRHDLLTRASDLLHRSDESRLIIVVRDLDNAWLTRKLAVPIPGVEGRWLCHDKATRTFFTAQQLEEEMTSVEGLELESLTVDMTKGYAFTGDYTIWLTAEAKLADR